ncbi:MAG: leucine--tRNA ligase [Fimbriimonadales bacterium]
MPDRYDPSSFEAKWRERWKAADLFATRQDPDRPKFYGLDFFPYPSGAGLSVGHCRNYIPTDVICRMKYMQGYNVLHPMGFDAFGLPAENEAIKNKVHPAPMVKRYAENYRRQMELIGISYDWSRSFASSDPEYYKWTQWIFKRLFEKGLAYRKEAAVNWCPHCKTVLADEEVTGGLCWRCESVVEKRFIPQWFFKITAYAQRLLDDLDELDWPEGIKQMQRNWIGRSEGVEFDMRVKLPEERPESGDGFEVLSDHKPLTFRVFTTRIDTVFGMTFAVLAPEHPLVDRLMKLVPEDRRQALEEYRSAVKRLSDQDRLATTHEKTGVFTGLYAINPVNGREVPIWVADYVLYGYGTGAIMAVPGHDERDYEFARKFGIPIVQVIAPKDGSPVELPWVDKDGVMVESGEYTGMTVAEGQEALGEWMEALGIGERKVQYRLRDWLISRQRYWGCPIPIIHDADGHMEAVPDDQLPVLLPDVEHYEPTGDGTSPLAHIEEFVNCTDSEGRLARRETDTMGGFACSSWYFLRFCDPLNGRQPWSPESVRYWMPVDCYVGGAEHAVMHLLYARFWTKFLYDEGLVPVKEPFQRLENQGMVLALTPFRHPRENERLEVGQPGIQITFEEAQRLPEDQVFYRWEKMSKSKGNVVTPDEAVERFGADALRVYELFVAPFDQAIQWTDEGLQGAARFLSRVFRLSSEVAPWWRFDWADGLQGELSAAGRELRRRTHQTIRKATEDIERFAFNTYIAALMTFVNSFNDFLKKVGPEPSESDKAVACEALQSLILLLSPAAPHTADEIWESLGGGGFTYQMDWPKHDEALCQEEKLTIAVQVNGKLRDTVEVDADATREQVEQAALSSAKVQSHLSGRELRKVVYVPGRLVNIVAT